MCSVAVLEYKITHIINTSITRALRAGGISMNEKNFASEILSDLNRSVSRWKIAFVSMAIIEFITIAFFLFREV